MSKAHYKTVWLSDIHLGCKDCKAEYLLDFLDHSQIDTLYLVGDIVDIWAMSKQFRWPKAHNNLFHKLLSLPSDGTRVIYLPGNHDEPLQKYNGMNFGDIEIHRSYTHITAQGKKLLVLHGDQFDQQVCFGPVHSWVGDVLYDFLLFLNRWYNWTRVKSGQPYWSLASYIKGKLTGAGKAIARYRKACCDTAKKQGFDGVVCGHIHHPEIVEEGGVLYLNDGDWIENCSALVESNRGDLSLVYWAKINNVSNLINIDPEKNIPKGRKIA
ncbi:UDP-2,3-diacylglucosamine diphosphatase [Colwellia sp. 20A7]|uniref:UDP-2,3-diacylglucosamine diphosphatase n=1 Tax=Colwellia sp. 20A7 TaxID=2689569 RepID=UPI00191561DC|nr:UDP-2,3-diacylglucosamine diphosphatase [Colwellia sp. 20A7]